MRSEKLEKKADYDFLKYLISKNGGNLSEATRICKTTYPTFMRKTLKEDSTGYLTVEELRALAEYYKFTDGEILKMIFSREL